LFAWFDLIYGPFNFLMDLSHKDKYFNNV
jgi:hypothetical protein